MIRSQILNPARIDSLLKKPAPVYHALTDQDRKEYILRIDENAIKKSRDTIIFKKRYRLVYLPVKFTNASNDTLKYFNMNCSWLDIYFTDNEKVEFERQICYKNSIVTKVVSPHHTENMLIPIISKAGVTIHNLKFRIGMSLQKLIAPSPSFDFPFVYLLRPETRNMIWSNEVSIQ